MILQAIKLALLPWMRVKITTNLSLSYIASNINETIKPLNQGMWESITRRFFSLRPSYEGSVDENGNFQLTTDSFNRSIEIEILGIVTDNHFNRHIDLKFAPTGVAIPFWLLGTTFLVLGDILFLVFHIKYPTSQSYSEALRVLSRFTILWYFVFLIICKVSSVIELFNIKSILEGSFQETDRA